MEYRPTRVSDIIRDLNRVYYLPAIQREFVWEPTRIENLFDSIMGDYPIGSFLFWKVKQENKDEWVAYEFIRNYDKESPHNDPANLKGVNRDISLVLDGQQRMTSLYIGLKGSYRHFYYQWRTSKLYLNLLKPPVPNEDNPEEPVYQFSFREDGSTKSPDDTFWYPVGRILDFEDPEDAKADIEQTMGHLTTEAQSNARKLLGRLHTKIHTTLVINYYEEPSQDYDKVLTIFVRANSGGKPLEYSDLLLSTATAKWRTVDARSEIHGFTDELNQIGAGYSFGKDFVLKACLYLTENLPVQYKVKNFTRSNLTKIEDNWSSIKTHLRGTVRLAARFGLLARNIVAPLALLPLAYYLKKRGLSDFEKSSDAADVRVQNDMRRWLVTTLLKNAFGGASDTKLSRMRESMDSMSSLDAFPAESLYAGLGIEGTLSDGEIKEILGSQYQGRYTFLVLSLLYPGRDWKDMVFHEDHIFPKSEFHVGSLRKRGYDQEKIDLYRAEFNSVVNLQLITDVDNLAKSATPFDEWIATRDKAFRERHRIPEIDDYSFDRFGEFVSARKVLIAEALRGSVG